MSARRKRRTTLVILSVLNVFCLSLYLFFASWIWAPADESGLLGGPGDPIIWTFAAFPFLMAGIVASIIIIPRIICDIFYYKDFRLLAVSSISIILFLSAFEYDRSRQYNGNLVTRDFRTHGQTDSRLE